MNNRCYGINQSQKCKCYTTVSTSICSRPLQAVQIDVPINTTIAFIFKMLFERNRGTGITYINCCNTIFIKQWQIPGWILTITLNTNRIPIQYSLRKSYYRRHIVLNDDGC